MSKDVIIQVKRTLPQAKGRIYALLGQEVTPEDVLGEGQLPAGFRIIHLARELGVHPKKAVNFLKRQLGKTIFQGELLASRENFWGLREKLILSPVDGILDFYDLPKGDLRIKLPPKRTLLISGVYGIVDSINVSSGSVIVRAQASVIYGVVGTGREREGMLKILGSPDYLVTSKQLPGGLGGKLIVGGSIVSLDALEEAVESGAAGFISGGINMRDFKSVGGILDQRHKRWSDIGLAVMVTEGFGSIQIGGDIFTLLKEHDKKFAILDGNRSRLILPSDDPACMIYIRKTKPPTNGLIEAEPELLEVPVRVGSKVRIICPPLMGRQGVIEALDLSETLLPGGTSTYLATVLTPRRKVRLPYQNIEVIN